MSGNNKENILPKEDKEEKTIISVTVSKEIKLGVVTPINVTAKGLTQPIDILGLLNQGLSFINAEFLRTHFLSKQSRIIR